ncbi:uncharacterized protein LOC123261022 [Cotesia glomerata]|uniref:uncharacterized protein LOC123261022 n=1 Tax=Cotesia glomerata TaxID=32391 RepID=UPI001D02578E|nr:uncharacterized protein LOC123261022 [Cotesia glomerata]XP_044578412.1 uncharacterized protein LOC123261022 [Cotesia glomerata]
MLFVQVKYSIVNYYMWIIEQQCNNSSYRDSTNKARIYSMKLQDIMNSTVKALDGINYYVYQCDPGVHERSSENTYIELKRMIQTIIIDEKNLTSSRSCNNRCNLERIANDISNETECQEFLDCKELSTDYYVCEMDNDVRRYEWFEDSYGHTYGNKNDDTCHGNMKLLSSYFEEPFFDNCAYCVCTCKSKPKHAPNVITSISFRDQVSDKNYNKIVTGARFVEKDNMIHIQILQAEVLPHGKTINATWKPLENFNYNETIKNYYIINDDKSQIELRSGIDYGEAKIMNLNDVMCYKDEVVVGVRIRFARDSLDTSNSTKGAMELQIQTTRLDFNTGKLMIDIDEPHWITPKNQFVNEFVLRNRGNPRNSPKTDFMLTTNKSVKFYRSDLKKDAGQTTVPFFDSREVLFDEGFLLGGIGLFLRSDEESAGSLALRLFDFDMF